MAIESTAVSGLASLPGPDEEDRGVSGAGEPGGDGEPQELEAPPAREPVRLRSRTPLRRLKRWAADGNIARYIDDNELMRLGMRVVEEYQIDVNSRADWMSKAEKAMKFAVQETTPKTTPWPGACYSLDTDVLTKDGWRPVADLRIGDMVLSRAPDGTADYHPVTRTFRHHAPEVVHFLGKSIDLLVTPNHRMLVEDKRTGEASFIEASEFLRRHKPGPNGVALNAKVIPLTSRVAGHAPETIYGIPAKAYVRFLGWYISEGWAVKASKNLHTKADGEVVDYGPSFSSFGLAQSRTANPHKFEVMRRDIEACGFTYSERDNAFTIRARSMPPMLKEELRSLGGAAQKHIPSHVMDLAPELLEQLLDTLVLGDGHARKRPHQNFVQRSYYTTSRRLADQIQEVCQKIGLRGTISVREARLGGVINGRQVSEGARSYAVNIATKAVIQVEKLVRQLVPFDGEVACVEVEPHHTLYVRRNGKAVWCGNSNMIFPLITQAAFEFGARAIKAVVPNRSVVKGVVIGSDRGTPVLENGQPKVQPPPPGAPPGTPPQPVWLVQPGEKTQRAARVGEFMSWQLLVDMPEWKPQTDQLLHQIPIIGGAARKTFWDDSVGKNRSLYVSLINLVWNYRAASFESAPRHTEKVWLYLHEIEELERADLNDHGEGLFLPAEYGTGDDPTAPETSEMGGPEGGVEANDADAPHLFLEQHRRWDLDGDGYPEPYVVTVHRRSGKVVRIVARYDEETIRVSKQDGKILRIDPIDYYSLIPFFPNVDGGSYPMGFGHLLRPLNEAINTCFNQMFDAGTLQNSGAGFIGDQLGVHSGSTSLTVGKFIRVNTKGQSIRDSVFPIPFPGPSATLFQLLGVVIGAGKEMAGIQQILTGDAAIANAPPTTVLALIEQGIQGYTAIISRVFDGLQGEFNKLYKLNRKHLKGGTEYQIGDEWREITAHDFRLAGGVIPVSDPTMTTNMQKLGRAQMLLGLAGDPMMNKREIYRRYLEAGGIDRIDDLFAPGPDPTAVASMQMQMANAQAELGRKRAAEMKDTTQAYLNLAMARKAAGDADAAFIDRQLQVLQLQIESVNSQTKAAKVALDAHHAHASLASEHAHRNADRTADLVKHFNPQPGGGAGGGDDEEDESSGGQAQGASGPYPVPVVQHAGGAMGGVAPQPGDAGVPALSG